MGRDKTRFRVSTTVYREPIRTHPSCLSTPTHTYLPNHLPTCRPTYLPIHLPTYLTTDTPNDRSTHPFNHIPIHLPTYIPIHPPTNPLIYFTVDFPVHLPTHPLIYPPTYLITTVFVIVNTDRRTGREGLTEKVTFLTFSTWAPCVRGHQTIISGSFRSAPTVEWGVILGQ